MKIVYIIESLSLAGGVERITVDKIRYLHEHTDYQLTLIEVYDLAKPSVYTLPAGVEVIRLNIRKRPLPLKPFTFYKVCRDVKSAVTKLCPDIVVSGSLLGNIIFANTRFHCATIYESHGPRHMMALKFLLPRVEKRCDCIVSLTEGDRQEYRIARNTAVIPNFLSMPVSSRSDLSEKHCLFVGRLSPEKDPMSLLRIWKTISNVHTDWILYVVGDGVLRHEMEEYIVKEKMQDSVILHGVTTDIRKFYQHSSILLITSRFEGFSLVLVEAMAHGVPVVSYDCPYGPPEIITDGSEGFLVPVGDEAEMAKAVAMMMDDVDMRRRLSANALKRSACYSPEPVMRHWIELFESVVSNRK